MYQCAACRHMRCGLPCGLRALLNPHSSRVFLEARLILEHVAPNAVPVST
jgi:hypothetical protein